MSPAAATIGTFITQRSAAVSCSSAWTARAGIKKKGKPARSLKPGDVVTIPANVKHWHGAKANSWFSHLTVECPGEETSTEWFEPVDAQHYDALED